MIRTAAFTTPLLAALMACVLTLSACTATLGGRGTAAGPLRASGSPSATGPAAAAAVAFHDCTSAFNLSALDFPAGRRREISIGCGTLNVPLDYANESAGTVQVELVKVHDAKNSTGNDLLVNPGGPGASGIDLAVNLAAQLSDAVIDGFDLIGFDPRGVGQSHPIECLSDAQKDQLNAASPDVRTAAGFAAAKASAAAVAKACEDKYGAALAHFDTVDTAKDMERIQAALGGQQLNYLGFSYGTELGAQYAHLYPQNVRVEVLDGAVDPLTDDLTSFADQLAGFEQSFDQFAADCRTRPSCAALGDPRQDVYRLVASAQQAPIPSSDKRDPRKATSALVLTGVLSALYSSSQWPALAAAIRSALQGDAKGLLALADEYNERDASGHYTNIAEANTAISCNDSPPGPTDDTIRATAASWAVKYPLFGLWSAASLFSCQQWQPQRTPLPKPTAPTTPQQVLVVGNLHDPATPYQGAKDLTATLGHAELLTEDGAGHTSYLSGDSCIDAKVDAYLVHGTLPPQNTTCTR